MRIRSTRPMLVIGGLLLAAVLAGVAAAAAPIFAPASSSPVAVGTNPHSITAADLNRDGRRDLVTANYGSDNVSILLGDGTGGFSASSIPVGDGPLSVATGYFNHDLRLDLAVANAESDDVSILLGNGAGGFTAAPRLTGGDGPWYVAVGYLNYDLKADLAVSNVHGDTVSIFLGNGLGGFTSAAPIVVGDTPYGVVIAHLNHDFKPDLAVANQFGHSLSILLGDGSGGFTNAPASPIAFPPNTAPSWVVPADLNRDFKLDLAVTNQGNDSVSILLGNGSGGFAHAAGSPVRVASDCVRPGHACGPTPLGVADLDRDWKLDLVTGNIFSDNVSILRGNGSGGFGPAAASPIAVGDGPFALDVALLNRDLHLDLAVANFNSSTVTVLLNQTPG